jgi:hypothetical protein
VQLRLLWSRVLFEREQLLRAESLVVNLGCGLDEILQVSPEERHPSSFPHPHELFKASYLVKKFRSDTNSQ